MRRFWSRSIRRQLMLGIALVHAVLMSIFVLDLVERQRQFLAEQSIAQASGLAKTLAANSASWVLSSDLEGLNEVLQSQASYPGLRYAMVVRPHGRVVAHTDRSKAGLYLQDRLSRSLFDDRPEPRLLLANRELVDTAYPIVANGELVGWARVGISQSAITAGLWGITRDGILYTLVAILVGSVFAFLMARGLTQGLQRLVVVADGIREGRRDMRAESARQDEIGQLAKNLNQMLDALAQRERDLSAAQADVQHLATRDTLTQLPNRLLLMDRLGQAILTAQREHHTLALLVIDLDRFKTINDSLGHHIGDQLIQQVAGRLSNCIGAGDTLARLGGDEFVVVRSEIAQPGEAGHLAQRINEELRQPYWIEGHELNSSCSIGISIYPDDGNDAQTLLRNADTAMYHAKEGGRGDFEFFSSDMNRRAVQRLKLENELRNALLRDEFRLLYQPQVDMRSGQVVGAESLIRWHHPEMGIVAPTDFIPVAEDTGLIRDIGAWVLREACRQQLRWCAAGLPPLRIAVNLSVRQVEPGLVDLVSRVLSDTGLDARYLDLEITESLLMHNLNANIAVLRQVSACGAQISMDDFGTGYSSLSSLKLFPVQTLKIDRSFVRDLVDDQDDANIVRSIVAMAHSLGLRIIAEGVENEDQLGYLRELGCDEYQGYLFSRPVTAAEFQTLFAGRAEGSA
ncbi:signal transduction protein [Thiohalobacter thiocyanaticus]|uniref:cyclic-guanylate-specific phosphodiesterase n=1 Tax=Thiohalobacter thiocyanaticus TaxID=585455 RepID=A0A1Z4VNJ3_9GAMM|nr:EAL domain-containing protein [Thiohalobacter thiocyanaticus]BAZ93075.1 signal transduction protein [Thiohalobacter thiocyanaticus]